MLLIGEEIGNNLIAGGWAVGFEERFRDHTISMLFLEKVGGLPLSYTLLVYPTVQFIPY